MLDKFLSRFGKEAEAPAPDEAAALETAVAALFVEAARADETYDDREKTIIDQSLAAMFALGEADAAALRLKGETAQGQASDIQRFTRIAKEMPQEEKVDLIERLWTIILSDGERCPFEDTLVRRICGLIYVDDRVSGEARVRAEAKLLKG